MDLECGVAAWHTFNDMNVAKLQSSSIVTSNAYILFYALRPEDYKGSKGKRKDKDRKKDQNPKE